MGGGYKYIEDFIDCYSQSELDKLMNDVDKYDTSTLDKNNINYGHASSKFQYTDRSVAKLSKNYSLGNIKLGGKK